MKEEQKETQKTEPTEIYFVYGTLKRGYGNGRRLFGTSPTAKFVKEATTEAVFTLVDLGAFPGVLEGGETAVVGELWEVSDKETKARLDMLEGYSGKGNKHNLYNKEQIVVDGKDVIIYILNTSGRDRTFRPAQIVESGKWV